jgi:diguanylate cyclase
MTLRRPTRRIGPPVGRFSTGISETVERGYSVSWNDLVGFLDVWSPHIPVPLALAAVATIGYLMGRRRVGGQPDVVVQSRRELRRAQTVARELENISVVVQKHLTKHQASLSRFKHRVEELGSQQQDAAWRDLCLEAEEMLKPTLQLASQIANAYDDIRRQTNHLMAFTDVRTDPLTGIYNRRALDESLASQFAMRSRYGSTFSMAMFDIDHFKAINDQHGHLRGDQVLQEVARLLDESVRETDIVARYGGEEFVIVMPETGLEGAGLFANRTREEAARRLTVTLSGGVTVALDGDSSETMLARVDAALYHAKNAGRNCVFRHNGERIESVVEPESAMPR